MKTISKISGLKLALASIMACGILTASVMDRSAFDLIKEGNKYVIEQSRDKVVQIRSEKSKHGTTPTTWYVTYFDKVRDTDVKTYRVATGTELKFTAGNLVSVHRDLQLLETSDEHYAEMDMSMLTVDSNEALDVALKEPILTGLKVMSSDMVLEQGPEGYPVWKVSIWAARKDAKVDVKVGEIWVSSVDGKVCKMTINPGRVG